MKRTTQKQRKKNRYVLYKFVLKINENSMRKNVRTVLAIVFQLSFEKLSVQPVDGSGESTAQRLVTFAIGIIVFYARMKRIPRTDQLQKMHLMKEINKTCAIDFMQSA